MFANVFALCVDFLLFIGFDNHILSFFYGLAFGSLTTYGIMRKIHKKIVKPTQMPFSCKQKDIYTNFVGVNFVNTEGKKVGFYCNALGRGGVCAADNTQCLYH